jgi:hypothetical protein
MVGETEAIMNEQNGSRSAPPATAAQDLGQLLHGLLDLAELQAELLKVDTQKSLKVLVLCGALVAAAIGFAIASAVAVLLTLSALLNEWTALSRGGAMLTATLLGLLLTAGTGYLGWRYGKKAFSAFGRSKSEMRENLAWFKRVLKHSSQEEGRAEERF